MEREHTLQWLDLGVDTHSEQELSKIQREWDADHFPEALRLCEQLLKRAEGLQLQESQGLAYCFLGETYRLMGVYHYQDAAEAFGKARVQFALDGTPTSNRNKGIAYWSLGMIFEQSPGHWDEALRNYQSALETIQRELREIESQSALPRSDRDRIASELGKIERLITEDQENLLGQQRLGDPKMISLMRQLVAAEHRFQEAEKRMREMVERAEKAAMIATKATQHAYFAARASQAVQAASDNTSRKALHATRRLDQAMEQMNKSTERLLAAIEQIEAAARHAAAAVSDSAPSRPTTGQERRRKKAT
jgi:tetratricopeptide (TPR) repeat protein